MNEISTSLSIETLEEIVRNCQRNEQRLHELKRQSRHERKKAERLLRETYRTKQQQRPIEFFISLEDDTTKTPQHQYHQENNKNQIQDKSSLERVLKKSIPSIQSDSTHRVRFNIPEKDHLSSSNQQKKSTNRDDEITDLAYRCEDLLSRLHTHRNQATILENDDDLTQQNDQSITLQQSFELLRPEFISHSRQRAQHVNHLREEREHQQILPNEMRQSSKKKYEQLPEVNDRLQKDLMAEIRQRNNLRAKIFRIRLREHVLLHGRTNIDKSVTMIDM